MIIPLLGATGSGKSTVARAIEKQLGIPHISTGDFVRKEFPNDPIAGGLSDREKQIREYVDSQLAKGLCVLDGFPRHEDQLMWLMQRAAPHEMMPIYLPVGLADALSRVEARGREDAGRFMEHFPRQNERLQAMLALLIERGYSYMTIGCCWTPDDVASWLDWRLHKVAP